MFYQKVNIDSVKVISDSLKAIADEAKTLENVGFDINNLGNNDIILTVLGYSIVFLALLILYVFIYNLTKVLNLNLRKRLQRLGKDTSNIDDLSISGETTAAIALAITLHLQEAHDFENTVITIKKMQSSYSPWNSKIYGLRQNPKY